MAKRASVHEGRYRIHAVAELTGVPEATLRAWERRYAVFAPSRTTSGYRLYSEGDVSIVRHIRELCDQGVAVAEAARLASVRKTGASAHAESDPFERASRRIVEATRRMDPEAIESEVRAARTLSNALTVVERVFTPAMTQIGRDWERGEISIGHEHLASEIIVFATRDMLRLLGPARPRGHVVLACFAEEDHVLPLYAAGLCFAEWGYHPHVLGARTPPAGLAAAVQRIKPGFVGLSLTIAPSERRTRELLLAYADVIGDTAWAVGGAAVKELTTLIEGHGGHVVPRDAASAHALLGRLLTRT